MLAPYRYEFEPSLAMEDVEASLVLALLGVESLHGETAVQLASCHLLDADHRKCVIRNDSAVGRDLNRLFAGFLRREFGATSFHAERVDEAAQAASATAA